MKKTIAIILSVICLLPLFACSAEKGGEESSSIAVVTEKSVKIETPFAVLRVSEEFDENISYEVESEEPYTLLFTAKKDQTKLFSLVFDGEGDALLGTIVGADENTFLYLNTFELDENSENYTDNCTYQEGVNEILSNLSKDYQFIPNQAVEAEYNDTFDIQTDVVTLKYPKKWQDKVQIDVTESGVKFSCDGTPLFDFMFVECDGFLLGSINDTPVYLVTYDVEDEELMAMQEDSNVILNNLTKNPDFVLNR